MLKYTTIGVSSLIPYFQLKSPFPWNLKSYSTNVFQKIVQPIYKTMAKLHKFLKVI